MNNILYFTLILLFMIAETITLAQWQGDTRLTNNSANSLTSFNNARCVASGNNYVHVAWYDARDGNTEIYYKRSTDDGASWGTDTRLTNIDGNSDSPTLIVSGSVVHLIWRDARHVFTEIYYKRSTDNGISWSTDTRITFTNDGSINPAAVISGQVIHVVWEEEILFNREIFYKRSTDAGMSWDTTTRLTNWTNDSHSPSVAASGTNVHVLWTDYRDSSPEIYYKRSTDGGMIWSDDERMSPAENNTSEFGMVSANGSNAYMVWSDARPPGCTQLYYRHTSNSGATWEAETMLTTHLSCKYYPSFVLSGSSIHAVWEDKRDGNSEIYYKASTNGGVSWTADMRLTNQPAISEMVSMAVSGSALHVVWRDLRDGNYEIYYKRDPNGNPIGITQISSEIPGEFILSQNYPNPFNPSTNIEFSVADFGLVKLSVFDILGREIAVLVNEKLSAGVYNADFNGENLSSGVYFYQLTAGGYTITKKMLLAK